jgi:ribosomal protein S21
MKNKSNSTLSPSSNTGPEEMDWSHFSPIEVKVYNNFDKAFKMFRTLVQSEKILSIFKQKQAYEKPSEKKRRKSNEAQRRLIDADAKMKKIKSGEYEKEKAKKLAKKEKKMKEKEQPQTKNTVE